MVPKSTTKSDIVYLILTKDNCEKDQSKIHWARIRVAL